MAKKKSKKYELPSEVYVYWEHSGDGDFFLAATEHINGIDAGTLVGIYDLSVTKRKVVIEELK